MVCFHVWLTSWGILLRASPEWGAVGRKFWNPQLFGWHLFILFDTTFPETNIAGWNIPNLNDTSTQSGSIFQPAMLVDPGVYVLSSFFWAIGNHKGPLQLRIKSWKQFGHVWGELFFWRGSIPVPAAEFFWGWGTYLNNISYPPWNEASEFNAENQRLDEISFWGFWASFQVKRNAVSFREWLFLFLRRGFSTFYCTLENYRGTWRSTDWKGTYRIFS